MIAVVLGLSVAQVLKASTQDLMIFFLSGRSFMFSAINCKNQPKNLVVILRVSVIFSSEVTCEN